MSAESPLISIVIPTLNEEDFLERTIESVRGQAGPYEIIIADGGSTDSTLTVVPPDAKVIKSPRGRAVQMNRGAAAARGTILLFLHSDTLLPEGALASIRDAVRGGATSGIFRLAFDDSSLTLKLYALATRLKHRLLCFGDRAIFAVADSFRAVGGYREVPIFEDLMLADDLQQSGAFRFLEPAVETSARRFQSNGPWTQQWLNVRLWLHYLAGTKPEDVAHRYSY